MHARPCGERKAHAVNTSTPCRGECNPCLSPQTRLKHRAQLLVSLWNSTSLKPKQRLLHLLLSQKAAEGVNTRMVQGSSVHLSKAARLWPMYGSLQAHLSMAAHTLVTRRPMHMLLWPGKLRWLRCCCCNRLNAGSVCAGPPEPSSWRHLQTGP